MAVLGLGRMGAPMAANLVRAGFEVTGWRRTAGESIPGVAIATGAAALAGALTATDVVILTLADAAAIEAVLFTSGAAGSLRPGVVVIDMGTSGPVAARDHASRLAARGISYLDAPVSGGVKGAEDARLTILVGGEAAVLCRARPVLEALGTAHLMGPCGAGQTAKLANQIVVAGYIAAVAEGLRFAESQGLDAAALLDALGGGFADSAILRQHGPRMAACDFAPRGTCNLHLKDLRLAKAAMGEGFDRLTTASEVLARFARLAEAGQGGFDHSACYLTYIEGWPDRR